MAKKNRYAQIIEKVFLRHYKKGATTVEFSRDEILDVAKQTGIVQIEQDMAMCAAKFPDLQCRPIAAQFMANDLIALFEFEQSEEEILVTAEKHYRLVPPEEISREELIAYSRRQE